MSEVTITIEIQDRFDKAFGDLADAINAAKAMSHVEHMQEDVRNGAMRVVVRALEKAFCAIDEIAPHSLRAKPRASAPEKPEALPPSP